VTGKRKYNKENKYHYSKGDSSTLIPSPPYCFSVTLSGISGLLQHRKAQLNG